MLEESHFFIAPRMARLAANSYDVGHVRAAKCAAFAVCEMVAGCCTAWIETTLTSLAEWTRNSVHAVLRNPAYAGLREVNKDSLFEARVGQGDDRDSVRLKTLRERNAIGC